MSKGSAHGPDRIAKKKKRKKKKKDTGLQG